MYEISALFIILVIVFIFYRKYKSRSERIIHRDTIFDGMSIPERSRRELEGFIKHGVKYKMWIISRDENICEECMLDGEIKPVGEVFSNGMMYPRYHDKCTNEKGCRCTLAPRNKAV